MNTALRISLAIVFAALIVSLSAAQGLMRGPQDFGQSTIVICTGQGLAHVTLDHEGAPVEAAPICPDTSVPGLHTGMLAPLGVMIGMVSRLDPVAMAALALPEAPAPTQHPRAPPWAL